MTSRVPKSMALWERAQQLIPGGTQIVSRRPTRYAYGVSPVFAAEAKGARFKDVDGREYIDWLSGIGAIILGVTAFPPTEKQEVEVESAQPASLDPSAARLPGPEGRCPALKPLRISQKHEVAA